MKSTCFNCNNTSTQILFDHHICNDCKTGLRLFSTKTVKKHQLRFQEIEEISYQKDISNKLKKVELTYIKAKIKLLDIQEKLNQLK